MSPTALVICGGGAVRRDLPDGLDDAVVIAADGGVAEAFRLGLTVDVLVGDMDSAAEDDVERVRTSGGEVERHDPRQGRDRPRPRDRPRRPRRGVPRRGAGRRRRAARSPPRQPDAPGVADVGVGRDRRGDRRGARAHRPRRAELAGSVGELVSLFALGGPAIGVTTAGLRWPLANHTLEPGSSLGISNEFAAATASVRRVRRRARRDPAGGGRVRRLLDRRPVPHRGVHDRVEFDVPDGPRGTTFGHPDHARLVRRVEGRAPRVRADQRHRRGGGAGG